MIVVHGYPAFAKKAFGNFHDKAVTVFNGTVSFKNADPFPRRNEPLKSARTPMVLIDRFQGAINIALPFKSDHGYFLSCPIWLSSQFFLLKKLCQTIKYSLLY